MGLRRNGCEDVQLIQLFQEILDLRLAHKPLGSIKRGFLVQLNNCKLL
jgi:hypothetical protein